MDLDFNKEQDMLRKSVAEFLAKECPFDTVREIEDSADGFDKKMWKKMARLGWMEIHFPEAYGGLGDPFVDMTIIMEEMGKKAFPSPFFSTVILCGEVLLKGGSEDQKRKILPKVAAGKRIMALAQYEEEASYLESGIQLTAEPDGDGYMLNGKKMFVLDANIADDLIVCFRSADWAVHAAVEMQRALDRHNARAARDFRIGMGIGIEHGRILLVEGVDLFGDPVNIASKLGEDLADPGTILVGPRRRRSTAPGTPSGKSTSGRKAPRSREWISNTTAWPGAACREPRGRGPRPLDHQRRGLKPATTLIPSGTRRFSPRRH